MMRPIVIPLLVLFASTVWSDAAVKASRCPTPYAARLVSLQGKAYTDISGKGLWQPAQLNDLLCEGSRVKVETYSRASLALSNGVVLRLDQGTVLSLSNIAPSQPTALELLKGFIHFISRTPKQLKVSSPIANAGPEGTEFAMRVEEHKASLWVYEGQVRFFNRHGEIKLLPGQGAETLSGQAPKAQISLAPRDAVQWALYYPPILPYPDPSMVIEGNLRSAIDHYRRGRIDQALRELDAVPPQKQSTFYLKIRAALRLTGGRVALARQDILDLLAADPADAEALSLESVIALTQNRKDEAIRLADRAVAANPDSAVAYSALSYAEQSRFDLDQALAAANKATKLASQDAMVWARKAELELSKGLTADSEQSAKHALSLDPSLERTQTMVGFSYLMRMEADTAREAFEKAVQFDSASPLARLGLGLAKIRSGDLEEGRRDLEIAAILDPENSLVRSYLGKAYYEERRSTLAEDQFKLAKERDPKDPTPYFYDAINKQTTNRPVEALYDMQKAIELNDNRAVNRSKLLLDEDEAARTANLARLYNDLGFGRVALKEAWESLSHDSTNPSAHRFLLDAYNGLTRNRIARSSELLQAQLLQPINITPVQPQLTGENIGILNSTGPGTLSMNEYDALFNANGAHIILNGAYGSNNTKTDNAIISGIYNNLSMSLGQFHYQTDGFRENDSYQQNIYNAFAQYAFTPDLNVQFELKSDHTKAGDVPFRLNDINTHEVNLNKSIDREIVRIGGHYRIDLQQELIASGHYVTLNDNESNSKIITKLPTGDFTVDESLNNVDDSGYQAEVQHHFHPASYNITTGFGYTTLDRNEDIDSKRVLIQTSGSRVELCAVDPALCEDSTSNHNINHVNGYIYSQQYLLPNLITTLGFSFDSYEDNIIQRNQFNPKFGALWKPLKNLTLRSAVFRTLKRPFTSNQTIEPTQIAGFNQFFDGSNGTSTWLGGFGIDYNPFQSIFLGGELTWRDGRQPVIENDAVLDQGRNESAHLAYFYWLPFDWASFRSEYRYEEFSRDFTIGAGDPTNPRAIVTQEVPISLNLFHDSGVFAKFSGTYIDQKVELVNDQEADNPLPFLQNENENFWTFDMAIGYRFPKKFGIISFELRNIFDNKFNYQSTFDASGPQLTPFVPERQLFGKLSLFY